MVSVDEHQTAGVQLDRPPSGRVGNAVPTDIDGMSGQLTEILDHHPATLSVGARIDAHAHVHRQLPAGPAAATFATFKHPVLPLPVDETCSEQPCATAFTVEWVYLA